MFTILLGAGFLVTLARVGITFGRAGEVALSPVVTTLAELRTLPAIPRLFRCAEVTGSGLRCAIWMGVFILVTVLMAVVEYLTLLRDGAYAGIWLLNYVAHDRRLGAKWERTPELFARHTREAWLRMSRFVGYLMHTFERTGDTNVPAEEDGETSAADEFDEALATFGAPNASTRSPVAWIDTLDDTDAAGAISVTSSA